MAHALAPLTGVGSLALFVAAMRPTSARRRLVWLTAWAPFAVPVALLATEPQRLPDAMFLLLQVTAGIVAGIFVTSSTRWASAALLVGLSVLCVGSIVSRAVSATTWRALPQGDAQVVGISVHGLVEEISGGGSAGAASRAWQLRPEVRSVTLAFDARAADRTRSELPDASVGQAMQMLVIAPVDGTNWTARREFRLHERWSRQQWEIDLPPDVGYLQVRPVVGADAAVQVRRVRLSPTPGGWRGAHALAPRDRQRLWHAHPNILGHVAALSGAVLLTSAATRRERAAGLLLASVIVALAGSRGGAAGLAACLLLVIAAATAGAADRASAARGRLLAWFGFSVVVVTAIAAVLAVAQLRPELPATPRWQIWSAAASLALEQPLRGGGTAYAEAFVSPKSEQAADATHAHNFALHLGAAYGLPAAFAAVWLLGALASLAWQARSWSGLAFIACVLVLQTFDATLFSAPILLLTVLGTNATRATRSRLVGGSPPLLPGRR